MTLLGQRKKYARCPLLTWFAAESAIGLLSAISQFLTLLLATATLTAYDAPWPEDFTRGYVHAAESSYYKSPWRAAILCVLVVVTFAVVTVQPLVFTSLVVLTRRVFVSTARDGDDATTTIGSRFLEASLRHENFMVIAGYFALADRMSVLLRALGMPIALNTSLPYLPLMDRPELVTVEEWVYSGGFLVLCNKQPTPSGPRFRSIALKSGSVGPKGGSVSASVCHVGAPTIKASAPVTASLSASPISSASSPPAAAPMYPAQVSVLPVEVE